MAQVKMQAYMDRHKLGPLFEDLMNRVLRDMPEEPLIYLLRVLYKRGGMEIPQGIRYGGLRKSVDLARGRSPDRLLKSGQTTADPSSTAASREYERPWLSQQQNVKPRQSVGLDTSSAKSGRKRAEWQGDTKIVATSFDELWEEHDQHRHASPPGKRPKSKENTRSSWAAVGLESGETFTSGDYKGPCRQTRKTEEELLAAEVMRAPASSQHDSPAQESQLQSASPVKSQRFSAEQHRRELENVVQASKTRNTDCNTAAKARSSSDEEDEALELLENAEDLKREGVKNVPASGYKLSKIMRERSAEKYVKLNINLSPRGVGMKNSDSMQSFEGYESDQENGSPTGGRWESDDEFESVSQVTGPRRPVWNVPDSDGETAVPLKRHSANRKHRQEMPYLAATAPEPLRQVNFSADNLNQPSNQTWSPSLAELEDRASQVVSQTDLMSARSGGWDVPEDSDAASVQDWDQRVKGRKRDHRAY